MAAELMLLLAVQLIAGMLVPLNQSFEEARKAGFLVELGRLDQTTIGYGSPLASNGSTLPYWHVRVRTESGDLVEAFTRARPVREIRTGRVLIFGRAVPDSGDPTNWGNVLPVVERQGALFVCWPNSVLAMEVKPDLAGSKPKASQEVLLQDFLRSLSD